MSILSRYLIRLHAGPFLFALGALTGLMLLNQVAKRLGDYDRSHVYNLVMSGDLEAHRRPGAEKTHMRITRRSLVAHLLGTATYRPDDFVAVLTRLGSTLDARQRRELVARLSALPNA